MRILLFQVDQLIEIPTQGLIDFIPGQLNHGVRVRISDGDTSIRVNLSEGTADVSQLSG